MITRMWRNGRRVRFKPGCLVTRRGSSEGSIQGIINKNEPYVTEQVTGYAAQQRKQDSENLSLDLGGLTEDSATL